MYRNPFVYVIQSQLGPCKVGKGHGPTRLKELQPGSFVPLFLRHSIPTPGLDPLRVEGLAHKALRAHRLMGEWFDVTPEVAKEAIETVLEQIASGQIPARNPGFVTVNVAVLPEMAANVRRMADERGMTISDVVDEAVREYLPSLAS